MEEIANAVLYEGYNALSLSGVFGKEPAAVEFRREAKIAVDY